MIMGSGGKYHVRGRPRGVGLGGSILAAFLGVNMKAEKIEIFVANSLETD
jgi:hypothetical protein